MSISRIRSSRIVRCIAILLGVAALAGADWRQFRGNDSRGVADGLKPPLSWSDKENVAWKSPLVGRSASSPIVVGGKVIVTASSGVKQDRLHVLAYDAGSGKQLWHRQFWATGRTLCHDMSANAAPSPASDGERVFAFFSSNDLACLDLDGNLLWYRALAQDYPLAGNDVGMSSSPLVVGNTVVVQSESQGDSFALGLDTQTGETRWQNDRKKQANWASPAVLRGETREKDAVLLQSISGLTIHDPYTGRERGKFAANCEAVPSSTAVGDVVYLPAGGMTAVRIADGKEPEVLWQENRLRPNSCSPIIHEGRVFTVNRTILVAGDAADGKVKWQMRLPQGMYWSSPVVAGGHLYVISYEGIASIIRLDDTKGESVFQHNFGEKVLATPAVVDGALFIQGEKYLWKVAAPVVR